MKILETELALFSKQEQFNHCSDGNIQSKIQTIGLIQKWTNIGCQLLVNIAILIHGPTLTTH